MGLLGVLRWLALCRSIVRRFHLLSDALLPEKFEEGMVVRSILCWLSPWFFLAGPEQSLNLHIFVWVVLGRVHNDLLGQAIRTLTIKGISPPGRVQLFLKLGVISDVGGINLIIFCIISVESKFLLLALHGG